MLFGKYGMCEAAVFSFHYFPMLDRPLVPVFFLPGECQNMRGEET